jgi:hypothetical protein
MADWFETIAEGLTAGVSAWGAEKVAARLVELSPAVARREIKSLSEGNFKGNMQPLVDALDDIARSNKGERSESAAQLAEYAKTFV